MSGRGAQNVFSEPKYCLCGGQHALILGLMLVLYFPIFTHTQVPAEKCKQKNISAIYQRCGIHPDGVRNLDCYGKYNQDIKCTWDHGNPRSERSYMLISTDKYYCRVFHKITEHHKVIRIFSRSNFTVEVIENADTTNCTKAVFRGSPKSLARCEPPTKVLSSRPPGALQLNVTWLPEDAKYINKFSVRYKALGSHSWNKTVGSQYSNTATVERLQPSLAYMVQIQCVTSLRCSQCPWSKDYIVQSELITQPVVTSSKYTDMTERTGCRLISITWKFPVNEQHDGYSVIIEKESGERPREPLTTTQPEVTLILSYSAYRLNISAYNNASHSPAVTHTIPQHEDPNLGDGRLNVTVHNATAFTVHWRSNLTRMYVCYSVEWMKKGESARYGSFYENADTHKTLSSLSEPLEPYKRYRVTLHVRPDKNTCNMKHINNSESTYGTTEFYYAEGSPDRAPANVSTHNVTVNSAVLRWSQIPEQNLRGFLLGYTIHYTEYHYRETSTEHNITVGPGFSSFTTESLKSGTAYQIQISAFTSAGEGIRSAPSVFRTDHKVSFGIIGAIGVFVAAICLLIFGSPVIKRVKAILWPRIPSPGRSDAVQKIESPGQLELLEALGSLNVEEWDTGSFQILEQKTAMPPQTLPSMLPLLRTSEDDAAEMTLTWSEGDTDSATDDTLPDTRTTHFQSSPSAFAGDYTTMEMFQQLTPQGMAAESSTTASSKSTPVELTMLKSMRFDYVRQFSTSPPSDSEHMSTIL